MSPRRFSRELYPAVEVQLVEEGGTNLPGRLEHGHILFAIMAVDDERFDSRPLYPSYALAVVSNMHKFARRRTLDVAELADEPVMLLRGGFASRDWFEAACRIAHFRPTRAVRERCPASHHRPGWIGLWGSHRALHSTNSAGTRSCDGPRAARRRSRSLPEDRLGPAAVPRPIRATVR